MITSSTSDMSQFSLFWPYMPWLNIEKSLGMDIEWSDVKFSGCSVIFKTYTDVRVFHISFPVVIEIGNEPFGRVSV